MEGHEGGRGAAGRDPRPSDVGPITEEDVKKAIEVTKPSAALHLRRYVEWSEKFGERGD